MNTKNIFKALALAMLMPAMLLTTACSSEDDYIVNNEPTAKKGFELPVTVNVTRQGDATRATYNDGTKKLSFSTGDKLFVKGYYDSYNELFGGILDYDAVKGNFSGTIATSDEYTGTADDLLSAADECYATLLPAGYDSYGFLTIGDEYGLAKAYLDVDFTKTLAATKALAVEQFSYERATSYSSGFSLAPGSAILNFTITGLSDDAAKTIELKDGWDDILASGSVTPSSGTATFAIGVNGSWNYDIKDFSLKVGGNDITLSSTSTTLEAGHIYNITRSAAPEPPASSKALSGVTISEKGWRVGSDGNVYEATGSLPDGVTAEAMIAYVSDTGHGLALALSDEASTMEWSTACGASGAAAHTPVITGGTWRLPSKAEWKQMFAAFGGNDTDYTGLSTAIGNAGGTTFQKVGSDWPSYWSSTPNHDDDAWAFTSNPAFQDYWAVAYKTDPHLVRACLAF